MHLSPIRKTVLPVAAALTCIFSTAAVLPAVAHGAAATPGPETRPFEPGADDAAAGGITPPRSNKPSHVPSKNVPRPAGFAVAADPTAKRAEGLDFRDSRMGNNGNSFSLEPPDQALCVGTTEVIEGVNNVFATYSKAGQQTSAPQSYDPFWNNGTPEIDRTKNPVVYGPFVSDPKCYWDPGMQRFFMTELQLNTDPSTGDYTGASFENIAVSKTASPSTSSADWYLYRINVRNDGTQGTPSHPGCPCLGDQPLIGADRYGFFVTTNEFSIDGPQFNGAQIYAMDKQALTGGTIRLQRIESPGRPLAEGTAYSVQPATSPDAAEWSNEANGTEYALSALEFTGGFDNRIASWAFTNTRSLTTAHPRVQVSNTIVPSEVYGAPPKATQRPGPYPLGQSLKDKLPLINTNDDRMNQTVFSGGRLWSGLNTAVKTANGPSSTGIAYFVVRPSTADSGTTSATMAHQGYVSVNRSTVMYPSIGVAPGGTKAAMVFTLVGPSYFPSVAYVRLTGTGATSGPVNVYAAGTKPADGFTGYPQEDPVDNGIERWGDYSAAVADSDGTVWTAGEYIPGTFGYPPYLANWGTAIGTVN
jgi:hypothetical protein